jgi:hypothetical protein
MRSRRSGRKCDRSTAIRKVGTVSLTVDNEVFLLCSAHPTSEGQSLMEQFYKELTKPDS